MGFRSYVRYFWGAISELFRPSLPWGFAAGSGLLLGVAASHQQQQQEKKVAKKIIIFYGFQKLRVVRFLASQLATSSSRRKSSKNHHFLWVSEVTLGIFEVQFRSLSVLHCHGDLPLGVVRFLASQLATSSSSSSKSLFSRRKKYLSSHHFLWVQQQQQQEKKIAKKSSFSMTFRSYVRHFFTAIGICCWEWFAFRRRS